MPEAAPALEARGLRKSFRGHGGEVSVLRGLDLAVRPGEFVAITGASGSGKSTLLHLLGLMDEPSSGEVLILGAPAPASQDARARLRNEALGFVLQYDSLLPDFTLIENVMLPGLIAAGQRRAAHPPPGPGRLALELLARFGLKGMADRYPAELSGGERQRAAVARAILNSPRIILADEPTGNLDRDNGELVLGTLRRAADELGVAVALVTHQDYAAGLASRVLRLSSGVLAPAAG